MQINKGSRCRSDRDLFKFTRDTPECCFKKKKIIYFKIFLYFFHIFFE